MKKAEGIKESTETVEGSKVKEENLEVAGGKCWKSSWKSALCLTGQIFKRFPMHEVLKSKLKYFSETWILPFAVLFAMVAYSVLAIVYYNKDG